MNAAVDSALAAAAGLLALAVGRIEEALPALGRVITEVEQDWRDAAGRAWVDRAVQLHRTLDRELDAALAVGRLVAALAARLAEEPVSGRADVEAAGWPGDPGRGALGAADRLPAPGDGAARPGAAVPGAGSPGAGPAARRAGGPRLGGTDAQRVDDERGMRIAQLDGE